MSYRNILVHVDSGPHAAARVRFALQLAEANQAHLTGLFVALSPFISVMTPEAAAGDVYYAIHEEIEHEAKAAQARFEQQTAGYREQCEWRQQIGQPVEAVCLNARYHDLVIIGQDDPVAPVNGLPADFPQAVVLGCGRPVLMLPYAGEFQPTGKHVMVAWNASREATRALTDALPILQKARHVTVLSVNPDIGAQAHGELPGADIAQYLVRHGVKVEVVREAAFSRDVGEVLLTTAADRGVDLLVMGLYGHSRLRELAMGGASRTMLASMTLPVLMSH